MEENLISGKVAVVTGATLGIGRAIAEALLVEGAEVVICARRGDEVRRAVEEMSTFGGQVRGMACDVRKYDQVDSLMRFAAEPSGGLDILVNNAGVGIFGHISQLSPADWHEVIDTNLTGVFYCCHAALPYLRKRGGGHIFNMSSLAGKEAFEGGSAYNASKFGLNGFSEALMLDLRYENIKVSYVLPGSVYTAFAGADAQSPLNWKLAPGDVAQVVVDILQQDQRSLTSRVELRPLKPPRKS
jgi:NAD(P)-dependent dehydrogenase (short-subunit alcohol dehydrogenase family)